MCAVLGNAEAVERKLASAAGDRTARKNLDVPIQSGNLVVNDPVAGVPAELHGDLAAHEAIIRAEAGARRHLILVDLVEIELHAGDRFASIEQAVVDVRREELAAGLADVDQPFAPPSGGHGTAPDLNLSIRT